MKPEKQNFFSFIFNTTMAMFMVVMVVFFIYMIIAIYTIVTTSKGSYSPTQVQQANATANAIANDI